uniref:Uncharacterized protein n=1 Tax=Oryza rufipogon TaxID=4529 RepID=A0A0E0Q7E0_ORYRU
AARSQPLTLIAARRRRDSDARSPPSLSSAPPPALISSVPLPEHPRPHHGTTNRFPAAAVLFRPPGRSASCHHRSPPTRCCPLLRKLHRCPTRINRLLSLAPEAPPLLPLCVALKLFLRHQKVLDSQTRSVCCLRLDEASLIFSFYSCL